MVCSFGDSEDVRFWQKHRLPLKRLISGRGAILEGISFREGLFKSLDPEKAEACFRDLAGLRVSQARSKITEILRAAGALAREPRPITHSVKYYEKGDRPLELLPARQWFLKILDSKREFLRLGRELEWHPPRFRKQYEQWVEGMSQDWCLSRQRFFGVPFPVWLPLDSKGEKICSRPIVPLSVERLPIDPLRDSPRLEDIRAAARRPGAGREAAEALLEKALSAGAEGLAALRDQPHGFAGENDVMDTWATSSMTPFINSGWGFDPAAHKQLFPSDLRPQAHEIIRTWAFYSIVKAHFHQNRIPWRRIAISGWVVDPLRAKMSKTKGNALAPENLMETYSADGARYWAGRARLGQDTAFDESALLTGKRLAAKLFNAARFICLQHEGAALESKNSPAPGAWINSRLSFISNALDQCWIKKMRETQAAATDHLENLKYAEALELIEKRFWLFCDNYIELVKARTYRLKNQPEGLSGLAALDLSLYMLLKLFAPFLPYITEEIWSWRFQSESRSIHNSAWIGMESWPRREPSASGKVFTETPAPAAAGAGAGLLDFAFFVLEKIRAQKSARQISLAAPARSLLVRGAPKYGPMLELAKKDLSRAGHVPEDKIRFEEGNPSEGEGPPAGPPGAGPPGAGPPGAFAKILLELD